MLWLLNHTADSRTLMSRLHIRIAVDDHQHNINFHSALFGISSAVVKADYDKWRIEDPQVNFATTSHGRKVGPGHIGIQVVRRRFPTAVRRPT